MALAIVFILIAVGSIVFHFVSPWQFTPLASNWGTVDDTIYITLWISGVVFFAINVFIAVTVVRFRKRKGHRSIFEPHNKTLELWLIGLTSAAIVAMLAPGLMVYADLIHPPKNALAFDVLGQQWKWRFRFPGKDGKLGITDTKFMTADNPFGVSPNDPNGRDDVLIDNQEVHLPLNKPIKVLLRSRDVIHDYYVPQFRIKMDIIPGMVTYYWFTPTKVGRYEILCSEYCGVGHYNMRGIVVVDDEPTFQAWLDAQPTFATSSTKTAAAPGDDLATQGLQMAQTKGCVACHSIDGSPSVGPTWKGLYGKTETLADGKTVVVDDAYLKESIRQPAAKIVKGFPPVMPASELSDQEMAALIAFIKAGKK